MKRNLVGKILGKIKIFVQDFVPIRTALMGGKMSKRLGGIKGCKYKTSSPIVGPKQKNPSTFRSSPVYRLVNVTMQAMFGRSTPRLQQVSGPKDQPTVQSCNPGVLKKNLNASRLNLLSTTQGRKYQIVIGTVNQMSHTKLNNLSEGEPTHHAITRFKLTTATIVSFGKHLPITNLSS